MQKRLVLCDLDKTLIDERYQLTVSEERVREIVARCEAAGIAIGLCSDSPLPLLKAWASRLGFTGPIIFEQGAGIWKPGEADQAILPDATRWFPDLRREVVFRAMLRKIPRYAIYVRDNTEFVSAVPKVPGSFQHLLFVSGTRRHSFAAHLRRRNPETDELSIDPEELRIFREEVETIARSLTSEPLDVDENPEYGILIIHAAANVKTNGVRALLERTDAASIVYIGDSTRDFIDDPRVVQCAVGNASPEYQRHCRFVAQASYTAGVVELLTAAIEDSEKFFG